MNQPMLMRNDMSTWLLYFPEMLSFITVPNQPNSITMMMTAPASMIRLVPPCRKLANPNSIRNMPTEPTIGQWLGSGR